MKNDIELRHILDLAEKSYRNNQYTFTDFLNTAQLSDFYDNLSNIPPCGYAVFGGYDGAERVLIRFGKEENLGYVEDFPITYVNIRPVAEKFADSLNHRDVLGTIMNLGMDREKLGDILIKDNKIWIIATKTLAELIVSEITRIKHTTVICQIEDTMPEMLKAEFETLIIQASSERIDGVVAKVCKLSRNEVAKMFLEGKIAINGRSMSNHSYNLKDNDIISVRGYGKFLYRGVDRTTKKGKLNIVVDKYV